MKLITLSAAMLLAWQAPGITAGPVSRDPGVIKAMTGFCESIRQANQIQRSAHPDSPMGRDLQQIALSEGREYTFRDLWFMAKGSGIPACDAMW